MTASTTAGTYFYSPDVKIFVKSSTIKDSKGNSVILDLSEDVINFSISRQTNATSSAQFTVANKGWKYTIPPANLGKTSSLPVETMDQVVIYLKRDTYLQYFTGYITNAPIVTLVPQPVTFQAQCTIYKIQNSFWDVNNLSFQSLMPGMLMSSSNNADKWGDGGAAQGIVNVLGNVVGVPLTSIHVAAIPTTWIANAAQTYNLLFDQANPQKDYAPQNGAQTLMQALDGAGIISGNNLINQTIKGQAGYVTYSGLSPTQMQAVAIPNGVLTNAILPPSTNGNGGALSYTSTNGDLSGILVQNTTVGKVYDWYSTAQKNKPQPVPKNKQDPDYWCVISWPYFTQNIGNAAEAAKWLGDGGSDWSNGRPLLVTSIANANQVVVKASIAGDTANNIVLSSAAWEYLAGSPVKTGVTANGVSSTGDFYYTDSIQVSISWADPKKVKVGPQNTTDLVNSLQNYGYALKNTFAQSSDQGSQTSVNAPLLHSQVTTQKTNSSKPVSTTDNPNQPGGPPNWGKFSLSATYTTSSDWARLCLLYGGFPVTDTNIALINLWVTLENNSGWATYYNPLGDTDSSLASAYGAGGTPAAAFQSLDAAAQWWGYKMNTSRYWSVGAVFDSKFRYSNGTYKQNSKNDKPLPSVNTPGAPKGIQSAIKIFKKAVQECPWDGGHYQGKAKGTWSQSSTNGWPYVNAGIAAPRPYGSWPGGSSSTGTSHNPATGTTTTITNTGTSFNTPFTAPVVDQNTLSLIGTPRAFVTDQTVLQSISTIVTSSLRNFQSAPNGDFLAWFPDYFGLYGQSPSLNIHDIEIIDFTIYHDDTQVVTHIAVSGDQVDLGTSVGLVDWMQSNGIVSIQIPEVMAILFGFASATSPSASKASIDLLTQKLGTDFATAFLSRYGMRPLVQEQPMIRSHITEFMYAWQLFMQSWANQYSSTIQLTFIPELYPGMRIRLADHGIELYVQGVQHQGDRAGGFYTTATVTCPVYRASGTNVSDIKLLHYGYPSSVG